MLPPTNQAKMLFFIVGKPAAMAICPLLFRGALTLPKGWTQTHPRSPIKVSIWRAKRPNIQSITSEVSDQNAQNHKVVVKTMGGVQAQTAPFNFLMAAARLKCAFALCVWLKTGCAEGAISFRVLGITEGTN